MRCQRSVEWEMGLSVLRSSNVAGMEGKKKYMNFMGFSVYRL